MGNMIAIIGVSGVGKTTLLHALNAQSQFAVGIESHNERPFQTLFKRDQRYALANQLDYLLYRAEQEKSLRTDLRPSLTDGGLDLDFHGFTRLFHAHGWLSDSEFDLCRRVYELTRDLLPPPDLIIHLMASAETVRERLASRNRINIASEKDAELLNSFIVEWLSNVPSEQKIELDVSSEKMDYTQSLKTIHARLQDLEWKLF